MFQQITFPVDSARAALMAPSSDPATAKRHQADTGCAGVTAHRLDDPLSFPTGDFPRGK